MASTNLNQAIARKTPLADVMITFKLGRSISNYWQEYPWDRMEKLNVEFQPHGIVIDYSEPPMTKDEWLSMVRSTQQRTY